MIRKLYNGRQRGAKVLAGLKVSASSGGLADSMYARERECSPVFSSVLIHVCQRTRVFSSVLQCSPVFSSVLQCSHPCMPENAITSILQGGHSPYARTVISLDILFHTDSTRTAPGHRFSHSLASLPLLPIPLVHSPVWETLPFYRFPASSFPLTRCPVRSLWQSKYPSLWHSSMKAT